MNHATISEQNKARIVRWTIKRSIRKVNPGRRFPLDAEGVDADRKTLHFGVAV